MPAVQFLIHLSTDEESVRAAFGEFIIQAASVASLTQRAAAAQVAPHPRIHAAGLLPVS